ncbi:MAG: hypothetical protein ACI8YQ_002113 [Polaribacter sp.]|jgi:hypothetical protein
MMIDIGMMFSKTMAKVIIFKRRNVPYLPGVATPGK